jgi:uncharacterized protein YyaL (SSP411 family)
MNLPSTTSPAADTLLQLEKLLRSPRYSDKVTSLLSFQPLFHAHPNDAIIINNAFLKLSDFFLAW